MYISIVCFIKLTSSNGYKSQKFVSLIDAPYFKNAFAPGGSIRRNTVHQCYVVMDQNKAFLVPQYTQSMLRNQINNDTHGFNHNKN